jgi:hypothetical protein
VPRMLLCVQPCLLPGLRLWCAVLPLFASNKENSLQLAAMPRVVASPCVRHNEPASHWRLAQ